MLPAELAYYEAIAVGQLQVELTYYEATDPSGASLL